jgi:SHS2 domain-containing protein
VGYRIFDFSSDVGVEAEAVSLEGAFIELGRGMAHILTDGSAVEAASTRRIDIVGDHDVPGTAVAFLNELAFLFDTDQFLIADGALQVARGPEGYQVTGTLRGETFEASRHRAGRGVKAATYHDAAYRHDAGTHRIRIVLDL